MSTSSNNAQALRDRLLKRAQALKQSTPQSPTQSLSSSLYTPSSNMPYTSQRTLSQSSTNIPTQQQSPSTNINIKSPIAQQSLNTPLSDSGSMHTNPVIHTTREHELRLAEAQHQSINIKRICNKTYKSIDITYNSIDNQSTKLLHDMQRLNDRFNNISNSLHQTVSSVH